MLLMQTRCLTGLCIADTVTNADNVTTTGEFTCSSCKPGYALQIMFHKDKLGRCVQYKPGPNLWCTRLNMNGFTASPLNPNLLCTKIQLVVSVLEIRMMTAEVKALAKQANVTGLHGLGVSRCTIRKETVCHDGSCQVRKQIGCLDVCQLKGYPGADGIPIYDDKTCNADACQSELSPCRLSGMMA